MFHKCLTWLRLADSYSSCWPELADSYSFCWPELTDPAVEFLKVVNFLSIFKWGYLGF